jgi:DNA-3-methyladenine glycosylase
MERVFYVRDAEVVAQEILGKILIHKTEEGTTTGLIVEAEAYYGENDPASHFYLGKNKKGAQIMKGPPGYAYIYLTYGLHYMLNVVTGEEGIAQAVLIRGVEPLKGIELMKKRRKIEEIKNLTNGPGKVTQAFGITKKENGKDIINSNLCIIEGINVENLRIIKTKRIGIKLGKEFNLRFYIDKNPFVSKY